MDARSSLLRQPWAWALLVFLVAGVAAMALWTRRTERADPGPSRERPQEGLGTFGKVPPFSLVERSGKEIRLDDLSGKVWIANFIYTHCTDTCPIQSAEMKTLQDQFARERDLRLVSITVDPKRDTPAALAQYADRFGADAARWWFLTGEKNAIYRLAEQGFHLPAGEISEPQSGGSAATHLHSPRLVVVDRKGEIRGYYAGTDKEALARLRRDVETLLRNTR